MDMCYSASLIFHNNQIINFIMSKNVELEPIRNEGVHDGACNEKSITYFKIKISGKPNGSRKP